MSKVHKSNGEQHEKAEGELKGTFASVLMLGGFLLGTWLIVFIIFMVRNGG